MVECPLEGYDMSPFVTNAGSTKASNSGKSTKKTEMTPDGAPYQKLVLFLTTIFIQQTNLVIGATWVQWNDCSF